MTSLMNLLQRNVRNAAPPAQGLEGVDGPPTTFTAIIDTLKF